MLQRIATQPLGQTSRLSVVYLSQIYQFPCPRSKAIWLSKRTYTCHFVGWMTSKGLFVYSSYYLLSHTGPEFVDTKRALSLQTTTVCWIICPLVKNACQTRYNACSLETSSNTLHWHLGHKHIFTQFLYAQKLVIKQFRAEEWNPKPNPKLHPGKRKASWLGYLFDLTSKFTVRH